MDKKIILGGILAMLTTICTAGEKPKLFDFKKNVYSQFGEDGILEKIFEKIGTTSKVAIEFGAADGFSCSNTANLWSSKDSDWTGILIECDEDLFQKAAKNTAPYSCKVIRSRVGISKEDSLEAILKQENLNLEVDILSIDIDGNDYYVFKSLEYLRPRVIICEYNVSIPSHLDVYPDCDNYIGCSVAALQRVASEKGYALVAITETNCFFVVEKELSKLAEFDIDREHIKIDSYISYIISDYSGCYKVIGSKDFIDAWGWNKTPSRYHCNGCKILPAKVARD